MLQNSCPSLNNYFDENLDSNEETPENARNEKRYEWIRFASLSHLPENCPVFAIRLATAGLYKVDSSLGDQVRCFACNFSKDHWQKGDKPFDIHRNNSPNCPFVQQGDQSLNIPITYPPEEDLPENFQTIRCLLEPNDTLAASGNSEEIEEIVEIPSNREDILENASRSLPTHLFQPEVTAIPSHGHQSLSNGNVVNSDQSHVLSRIFGKRVPRVSSAEQFRTENSVEVNAADTVAPELRSQTRIKLTPMDKDPGHLRFERNRLETFRGWPSAAPVIPRDLARSGFYYVGTGDRVQCVYCRGILKDWDPGDKPHIEHKNKFPRCPFLLGMDVSNVPYSPNQTEKVLHVPVNQGPHVQSRSQMEALGISTSRPKYPNYAVEATRYSSYISWPQYKHQTPNTLAKAGFFYAGFGDNVKCFYCDGGLKNWEPGDDPWVEHARWFPRCPFLRNVKGEDFIQGIQDSFNAEANSTTGSGQRPKGRVFKIEEREIKARLALPMVRAVLETGLSKEIVMHAIRKRLEETGDDFPNAEALMNAALELSDDPALINATVKEPSTSTADPEKPVASTSKAGNEETNESFVEETKMLEVKPGKGDLSEEVRLLKEQKTCKICLDNEVGMVFLPCGHLCCCVTCAPAVQLCPICRTAIRGTVRTYIP